MKTIQYEHNGKFVNTSEALINGYNEKSRLKLEYESGFKVYVNFDENPWSFKVDDQELSLPQYGIFASTPDGNSWALSGGSKHFSDDIDIMHSPSLHYRDTKGGYYSSGSMAGKGQISMKKEAFGWEIIPARQFDEFGFDPKLMGLKDINLKIESLKANGLTGDKVEIR